MRWKNGQEFVQVYTPISGPNVRLLEQVDRISNIIRDPGVYGSPMIPHKRSVRMIILMHILLTTKNMSRTTFAYPILLLSYASVLFLYLAIVRCLTHRRSSIASAILQFFFHLFDVISCMLRLTLISDSSITNSLKF